MAGYADPTVFPDGVSLDSGFKSSFGPLNSPFEGAYLGAQEGALVLHSGADLTARENWDGGITLMADPVNILLCMSTSPPNTDRGTFAVWGEAEFYNSTAKPFFQVKSPENIAAFDSVNVTVTNGSLSVGGSPVLTAGGLNAALSTASPPTSAAWTAAYVPRGNVFGGAFATGAAQAWGVGSIAHGTESSAAYGMYSSAIGDSALTFGDFSSAHGSHVGAFGANSWAQGWGSTASGGYSRAGGWNAIADGTGATAMGMGLFASSYAETVVGSFNLINPSANYTNWIATDSVFRVGNGSSITDKSDALNIRKNGEMTVTNKAWKANSSAPLADPVATDDSGGNALVVDGHTKLNGKVEISVPQGDISMGIYQ